MDDQELLSRITTSRKIFGGKPIIRGHRIAVEHILGMLAAGDATETLLEGYPSLEPEDIQACLLYAQSLVQNVRPELKVKDLADFMPEILEEAPYLTLLVLFGSRARGDAGSQSDWDFAFLCNEEQRQHYEKGGWDAYRMWSILQNAYDLPDEQIDIVDMKDCSELMAHYIAKEGKVIYASSPELFEDFQKKFLISDESLKAMRREQRERTLNTLRELKI
jgi:uncharacterized protein (DUF433 family)